MNRFYSYIDKIKSGEINSCTYVKKAVARAERDLSRIDVYFDEEEVQRVIDFCESLYPKRNKKLELTEWQVFIIACLYGFKWYSDNNRKYQTAYIEMARKNGKSTFIAAMFLYELIVEPSAQILISANSAKQSKVLFDIMRDFILFTDTNRTFFSYTRDTIRIKNSNSFIMCTAAESDKLDGYNCAAFVVDEYHEAKTSAVRDVLLSSQGSRNNPLGIIITTAGFNKSGVCYTEREHVIEILNESIKGDSEFGIIYTLDDDDDWTDEKNWIKANPNLGLTPKISKVRTTIERAKNYPSVQRETKIKTLNIWSDIGELSWVTYEDIENVSVPLDIPNDKPLFVGLDLSQNNDMSAVSYVWNGDDGKPHIKIHYYLPKDGIATHKSKVMYENWLREGYLTLTEGNIVDYRTIINDIIKNSKNIALITFDPTYSSTLQIDLYNSGITKLNKYYQGNKQFTLGTNELQRFILTDYVVIDKNPINNYNFNNVVLHVDRHGNVKPDKSKSGNKIDGVIATIMAITPYILSNPNKKKSMPVVIKV